MSNRYIKSFCRLHARSLCTSLARVGLLSTVLISIPVAAHAVTQQNRDLADFSLEELANLEITSVSKKAESLANAAASIFVITNDDIRRSGAATLPEALRLAPNLEVARSDARNYAITARGFNSVFENKLLVLIDGRTVYSPLFSGVFWDAQDVVLEDVERIEVISGAGATLWGANAVNGVINIITRSAKDTQGGLLAAGGSEFQRNGVVRHGGKLGNGGYYRAYAKYADNDDTRRANNTRVSDGWRREQTGFRADWGEKDEGLTVQGDAYSGDLHQLGTRNIHIAGANVLSRINRKLDEKSTFSFQTYLDHTERHQPNAFIEHLDTLDFELQHATSFADIHNVVWGGGYRFSWDRVENSTAFAFLPGSQNMRWANLFAQDEIDLYKDLRLTLGLKLAHDTYTGLEYLPNVRLAWKPLNNHLIWGSASRAVRAPSRIDRDFFAPTNPTVTAGVPQYAIGGGPNFVSEVVNTYELGYRVQPVPVLSYSATVFYSVYDKLRTLEPNPNGPGSVFLNKAEGTSRGIEMWGTWQAAAPWRLSAGFVAQRLSLKLKADSADTSGGSALASNDPSAYWMIRSSYDIANGQEFDVTLRHVSALPAPTVPAYYSMDLRYGWKVNRDLELSLVGQNLMSSSHPESGAAAGRSEFDRSLYVKAEWHF